MSEPARDERQWTLRWGRVGGRVVLAEGNAIGDDEKVEVFPKSRLAAVEAERDQAMREPTAKLDGILTDRLEAAQRRVQELEAERDEAREQIGWTLRRCNDAMGDGFSGTPNSAVAAVCDGLVRAKARVQELEGVLRGMIAVTEMPGTRSELEPETERAKAAARSVLSEPSSSEGGSVTSG